MTLCGMGCTCQGVLCNRQMLMAMRAQTADAVGHALIKMQHPPNHSNAVCAC